MTRKHPAALALILLSLAGCTSAPEAQPLPETASMPSTPEIPATPGRTSVTDLPAFDALIATRPTPAELRSRYPGLHLVLPGDISTRELRGDRSRYFVELDGEGRIVGGRFQ